MVKSDATRLAKDSRFRTAKFANLPIRIVKLIKFAVSHSEINKIHVFVRSHVKSKFYFFQRYCDKIKIVENFAAITSGSVKIPANF